MNLAALIASFPTYYTKARREHDNEIHSMGNRQHEYDRS